MASEPAATTGPSEPAGLSHSQSTSDDGPSGSEMAIYVGLPLIIAIFLAVVALLLLLVYFVLRAKNKQRYSKVPQKKKTMTNLSSLPYPSLKPPAIMIEGAPAPDMSFTVAPQLPDPAASQRYPFLKHKRQQVKTTRDEPAAEEKKQKKKLGNRRNGKHEQDKRAVDSGTHSASPSPPRDSKGARKTSSVSLSQFGEKHATGDAFLACVAQKQTPGTSADKPPQIFLGLTYLQKRTILIVNVERVVGLPPRDDGAEVDAYVRLFFVPRLPEMTQRKTSKTRIAKRELDPAFHEEIQYEAMSEEELINSTLNVQVLDYRAYGRHNIIGQGEMSLSQVPLSGEKDAVILQLHAPRVRRGSRWSRKSRWSRREE